MRPASGVRDRQDWRMTRFSLEGLAAIWPVATGAAFGGDLVGAVAKSTGGDGA